MAQKASDMNGTVWFDRGFCPEKGEVFTTDNGHVAISIGGGIERVIMPASEVETEKENLTA